MAVSVSPLSVVASVPVFEPDVFAESLARCRCRRRSRMGLFCVTIAPARLTIGIIANGAVSLGGDAVNEHIHHYTVRAAAATLGGHRQQRWRRDHRGQWR